MRRDDPVTNLVKEMVRPIGHWSCQSRGHRCNVGHQQRWDPLRGHDHHKQPTSPANELPYGRFETQGQRDPRVDDAKEAPDVYALNLFNVANYDTYRKYLTTAGPIVQELGGDLVVMGKKTPEVPVYFPGTTEGGHSAG